MAKRDSFLLRIDPSVLEAIRRWADDEMRSMNGQIEFLLRSKLNEAGRLPNKLSTKLDKSNSNNPIDGESHQESDSQSDSKSDQQSSK